MTFARKAISACLALVFSMGVLYPGPAFAMTITKEKELSREFKEMVFSYLEVIKEPLIADYVDAVGRRILSALPPQPFVYQFYVVNEDSFNAFAGPGGLIVIHSGLMAIMESEEELAGILSHEISHSVHRHLAERTGQLKGVGLAALAALAAGALLGATGGGIPGEALVIGALSAANSQSLAYSREAEMEADKTSLAYLRSAGYSIDGLVKILRKMRNQQWFGPQEIPTYLTTHPALDERMVYIGSQAGIESEKGGKGHRVDPEDFKWAHTKLLAMYGEEDVALRRFEREVKEHPESILAHYGYGLALARTHDLEGAATQLRAALAKAAFNPHLLIDLGRIHFKNGQYKKASKVLKSAAVVAPDNVEGLYYLGRTHLEGGEYEEAVKVFSMVTEEHEDIEEAYYYLGQTYGKLGDLPRAHYNLGVYYKRVRNFKNAMFHLKKAVEITEDPEEKGKMEEMIQEIMKERRKEQRGNRLSAETATPIRLPLP